MAHIFTGIDGLILLGLIVLDMIITMHFILQFSFNPSKHPDGSSFKSFLCQVDGGLSIFVIATAISYYMSLSHCIIQSIREFQPKKKLSGSVYHVISLSAGILYVSLAIGYKDIGKGVMLTCSMTYGSFVE